MLEIINYIKSAFAAVALFISVDVDLLYFLPIIMCIDALFGIIASHKMKEKFVMKKFQWGFLSKFALLLLPVIIALIGTGIGYDLTLVIDWAIKLLFIAEGYSILGNMYTMRTGKRPIEVDLISLAILWGRKLVVKLFNSTMVNIEKNLNIEETKDEKKD